MNTNLERLKLEKMPTGIAGFDEIARGGLPRDRTTLILGGAGTGKTVFALEVLVHGALEWQEPSIFVAFEENSEQILANAAGFDWDLDALGDKLFFLDVRLSGDIIKSGAFDLNGMLAGLKAKAEAMGAKRIVFDSVDVLLALLDNPAAERVELYRIHDWLMESGLTGIITARIESQELSTSQRYSFIQFMADCVVLLQHQVENRVSRRSIRIVKYRGSPFEQNAFPLSIGSHGIEVASFDITTAEYPAWTERLSSGVPRLDAMLNGGFFRGSSSLITGAPGTAKSTLCGAFVEAAGKRGERSLFVSFDEGAKELVRNFASVNIHLDPFVDSGLLRMYATRAEVRSAEEHLLRINTLLNEHQPTCLVVDPISAMVKASGPHTAMTVAQRLIHVAKSQGITLLCTSLVYGPDPQVEMSEARISTIADTWIHLTYQIYGGERNRALTIIKSRGARHSNQVRELVLSDAGIDLTDVYTAAGEVLMGTLRTEKEAEERFNVERTRLAFQHRRREIEQAAAEISTRIRTLEQELQARRENLSLLQAEEEQYEKYLQEQVQVLRRLRGGNWGADEDQEAGSSEPSSPLR